MILPGNNIETLNMVGPLEVDYKDKFDTYNEMNETVDSLLTSRENTLELNKQLKSLFEHVSRTFVRDAGVKNQNS